MLKGALITGVVVVGTVATVAVLSGEDPVTVIRVVDGDTIDARVDGFGQMKLKSSIVKKI